ncbi:peptidylprolyl isomerase [Devosia sp.]|uniref:peptidylprolyl isomerase n=1 Tax=Devosia sp. TaxID=1871048 RepID=UPI002AFE65D4|nr:peptidylprolyl isomerase [Devosia sp.]
MTVTVEIQTELGTFALALEEAAAPITVANFLAYVDGGFMRDMSAYRIVTLQNQPAETVHRIEVIQWGWRPSNPALQQPFPAIAHEPTSKSGLRHKHLTLSMARDAPGTAGGGFFICIGDQPELDEGGRRNPDGAGFAAFGRVVEGEDVIAAIFARAEDKEYVDHPVQFLGAQRRG